MQQVVGMAVWLLGPSWGTSVAPLSTGLLAQTQSRTEALAAKPVCIDTAAGTAPRDFQTLMRNAAGRREEFMLMSEIASPFALLVTGVIKIHCFPCCLSNGRTAATCTLTRGKNSPALGPITESTQKSINYPGRSPVVARCTTCT